MNGCLRSSIHSGQLVAIVLKSDQSTGRRTVGEVADILSPGDFHPRGIKVRLKDGKVGRVQEILAREGSQDPEENIIKLVILLIQRPDMSFYARKAKIDSGEEITTLGLDRIYRSQNNLNSTVKCLYDKVSSKLGEPDPLFNDFVFMNNQNIKLNAYHCMGVDVKDDRKHDWDWTGWLTIDQIEDISSNNTLSEESQLIFNKFVSE